MLIAGPIKALLPLAALGRRAYSLYLWNNPMLVILGPIGILATLIVSEASYRLVERPIMRRFRFPPRVRSGQREGLLFGRKTFVTTGWRGPSTSWRGADEAR
jgi:peptidoglycan/LPS O-acetylase OafA/YrhL